MFDISALLSLKPTGSVIDQGQAPGSEAAQINPFSEILSTQLETQGALMPVPKDGLPELATLAVAADQPGKLQQNGKMLPGELPGTLPITPKTDLEGVDSPEAKQINPLGAILASRVEAQIKPAGVKIAAVDARPTRRTTDAEVPAAVGADDAPEGPASVETAIPVDSQPVLLATVIVPAVQLSIPAAQFNAAPTANRPALAQTAAGSPAIVAQAQIAGTSSLPAGAPAATVQIKTDSPAASVSPAAIAIPGPITAAIPVATLAAFAQAPAIQADAQSVAPIVPATSTIALVAAQALTAIPLPFFASKVPAAEAQPAAEASTEGAAASLLVDVPAESPTVAIKTKTQRAQSAPTASAPLEETAATTQASATTAPAAERSAPAATVQPTAILAEARQPIVGPAAVSAPVAAPAPQDFATLVDRLIAARETAAPQPVQASIAHAEFGRVSLNFQQTGGELTVAMTSADPGFAPAVLAAMSADKSASSDSQPQPQVQAPIAAQAQAQTQSQSQSQPQSQSQNQQPGSGSGQLHQDAGQRGADGSGAQGRGGQERSGRYQSNPSPTGRDDGSAKPRNGTYA